MNNSRPNRILIIASYSDSIVLFRGDLIKAIQKHNVEVHVASPNMNPSSGPRKSLESMGVIVHNIYLKRTGMNPISDTRTLFSLLKVIQRVGPKYKLSYTVKPVIYGSIAAALLKVPHRFVLMTGLGYAFTNETKQSKRNFLQKILQRMYVFALARAEKIFFQNPDDEILFRKMKLLQENAKTCVMNGSGINVNAFNHEPLPTEPHFLMIARLLGDKGVREYAEASSRIRKKYPQAICSLVGWIDSNPDAISKEELEGWVSSGDINYLGYVEDVRPALRNASVYVLPSYREGTPRTVLEAMAMGRPIVTTDVPGCRETVKEGVNGILVQPKSVEGLVIAMERFITEPELVHSMGNFSREIAVEKYDVHQVNECMLNEMGITS